MADDINELLGEVESKYNGSENGSDLSSTQKSVSPSGGEMYPGGTEEIDAAIHSITGIPGPIRAVISRSGSGFHCTKLKKKSGGVVFVRDASSELRSGTSCRRNSSNKRQRPGSTTSANNKRFFVKPVFELSVENLEAERARRKQKEVIEQLFEYRLATVVPKIILDERKFKRIKSNVWEFFGDVRLFIDEAKSKEFNIDCNVIHYNGEEFLLCKSFVACMTCCAVFSYESHSYGTSTLRSHLKSCGKPRFNRKEKSATIQDCKQFLDEIPSYNFKEEPYDMPSVEFEDQRITFREECIKLQKQIALYLLSRGRSFETSIIKNPEFQKLLQMLIKIGSDCGNTDIQHILCSEDQLARTMIQKLYNDGVAGFASDMLTVYGVSFSFELWNEIAKNTSYLNMLCHYSDDKGMFKSVIIHTSEFAYESKGGCDLINAYISCLNDTGLFAFRRLLVIDYTPNMLEAFEREQFILCIHHCIDGMVQSMLYELTAVDDDDNANLPSFVELINQCRLLVHYFKVNKIQHDLPNYLHSLSSECNWKSVLKMLKSISDQWDHITVILDERGESFDIDEELMNVVIDFLQIFHDGIAELASVTYPTLNMVIPWWATLKSHCLQKEGELPLLAVLKSFMNSQIEKMTGNISLFHKLATMFDPRFKQLEFLTKEDRTLVQSEAEKLVKECEESFIEKKLYDTCNKVSGTDVSNLHSGHESVNLGMCLNSSYEIDNYLAEPYFMCGDDLNTDSSFNPLRYWTRVKSRFPHLYRVASWILSCPASSLRNNERLSENKWMVSARDIAYPHEKMNFCLFSKSYKNL